MPELTRRRALLAVASGAAALAGCTGTQDDDRPTIDDRDERERSIDDYTVERVRNEDGAVLFTRGEELSTTADDERDRYGRAGRAVVVTADGLEDLTFGDVPEADRLRSFAAETDFARESLYLAAHPVDACHEIHLQSATVEWDGSDDVHPHAQFCQAVRPADVDCSTGTTHTAGFAIRLPVAAEHSTGSGQGMSYSCGPRPPRAESFDATVTPAGGEDS